MCFSSSKSSQASNQTDNRIAATDEAIVARDNARVTVTADGAFDLGIEALQGNSELARLAIERAHDLGANSLAAIGSNADKAFEFVDTQRQDEEARTFRQTVPWLVAGASSIAIAMVMKGK